MKYDAEPRKQGGLFLLFLLGIALIFGFYFVQNRFFPDGNTNTAQEQARATAYDECIQITEIMSDNINAYADSYGAYYDWVEITNVSAQDVSMGGWKIAKNNDANHVKYFEFPAQTIKAGQRVVVFLSGTLKNTVGYEYHAPFRVSASGDTLVLFNETGYAVQQIDVPALDINQSYALISNEWQATYKYTPLLENTANYAGQNNSAAFTADALELSEVMAKNASYLPIGENYYDWVEIHNTSSKTVNLKGYTLSDSILKPTKWVFPDIAVPAYGYAVVYCSALDTKDEYGNVHTSFRLSADAGTLLLCNASGQLIEQAEYTLLEADISLSKLENGEWVTYMAPTPNLSNTYESAHVIDGALTAQNSCRVYINEIMSSTATAINSSTSASYDWLELYNGSNQTVDLSGWGLSDSASSPRKWQFPQGAKIAPGQYLGIYLSGLDTILKNYYHTNFSLSATGCEVVVLSDPTGKIVDRVPLGHQYSDRSFGRISGKNGFYYMASATPGTANAKQGYESRMEKPVYSVQGGMYAAGTRITLELKAEPGAKIYYTLDSSTPDVNALSGKSFTQDPRDTARNTTTYTYVYTNPITITSTTVVRAMAVKDGQISSLVETNTYLIGVSHTMQVISLVVNPSDLWDYNTGLYVYGPNATSSSPYGSLNKGANFWMTWEKESHIELFGVNGETILSQGCGMRLHGQYSRKEKQKPMKIIARSKYGESKFNAKLFPNRDYTEYQSFLLRSSGQDTEKTRMRDSILTSLAEGGEVMYQDTALAIVYINGEYWGHYNMRERINTYSICQWENWDFSLRDSIDLIKANTNVMQGSVKTWEEIMAWIKQNGVETDAKLAYVEQYIDVYNYLEYVALEMYTGNTDLLNCKKYRCAEIDGKWRWIFFDTDWAFTTDTNSVNRWLTPGGVGDGNKTDNSLYIALMKNEKLKDWYLTYFANKLAGEWSSESVLAKIQERYELLNPELDQHLARWGLTRKTYDATLKSFKNYAKTRPGRLLYFFGNKLSKADMLKYFGDFIGKIDFLDDKGNVYVYKK